jgi:integrase/recombinase XerD
LHASGERAIAERLPLKVADLDSKNRRAQLFEKGERARTVLFGERTARALRAWLRNRPFRGCAYVFTSIKEERPASGNSILQMLRRYGRRAGVSGRVNPHAFRHAFAREHILNGGDLASVSEMMGHTQIAVTKQFYAVFQAEELRAKHDAFSPVSHLPLRGKRQKQEGRSRGRANGGRLKRYAWRGQGPKA